MRCPGLIVVTLVSVAVLASGALATDRPLASLVPANADSYVELDTSRLLGRTADTAALRAAFGAMKSPAMIKHAWAELTAGEEEAAKVEEVLRMVSDGLGALGPRVAQAAWNPDLQSLVGAMMAGGAGGEPDLTKMMPKLLLVADLQDPGRLDSAIAQLRAETELEISTTESAGIVSTAFAGGIVELIHGRDWLVVGFPAELARAAANRASGAGGDSLFNAADFRKAMDRLPADAVYRVYSSPAAMRQFLALANVLAPDAGIGTAADEPFAAAAGVRVEEIGGREMATVYYTADLRSYVSALDAILAFEVALLKPILQQQKEQARRQALSDECGAQLEALAAAMDSYLADHGNRYPEADQWLDELRPYLEDASILRCPEDSSEGRTSYGMNAALSGLSPDEVADPEWTVLFYETARPGDNPSGGADDVPDSPRHVDGNNFAFVDGSVAAFAPADEEQPIWDPDESSEEEAPDSEESGEGA